MKTAYPISSLLHEKTSALWSISTETTVFDAIKLMAEKNIGALLVLAPDGRLAGMFTERDYTRKVALHGKSSKETRVREIIAREVATVTADDSVEDCMRLMTEKRVRHLPVVEGVNVVGIISIGDLVNWIISTQNAAIEQMEQYIAGQFRWSFLFSQFRPQFRRDIFQRIRHHAGLADDRHEIRVAVPTRYNVDVQVVRDARTRDFSEIDADIETVRLHHSREGVRAAAHEFPQVRQLGFRQSVQVGHFLVRHDHDVSAVVGITVEQRKTGAVAHDDEVCHVVGRLRDAREQAFLRFRFGREDVFDAPWRVQ
jgi:predicted transcriptional regulator